MKKMTVILLTLIFLCVNASGQFNPYGYFMSHKAKVTFDRSGSFEDLLKKYDVKYYSMDRHHPKDTLVESECSIQTLNNVFTGRGFPMKEGMWEISILIDGGNLVKDKDKNIFILEDSGKIFAALVYMNDDK